MSADLIHSEIFLYGFMVLNGLTVLGVLVWAYRRGWMSDLDDTMRIALDLDGEGEATKENGNG
jgi:hypothetical protein